MCSLDNLAWGASVPALGLSNTAIEKGDGGKKDDEEGERHWEEEAFVSVPQALTGTGQIGMKKIKCDRMFKPLPPKNVYSRILSGQRLISYMDMDSNYSPSQLILIQGQSLVQAGYGRYEQGITVPFNSRPRKVRMLHCCNGHLRCTQRLRRSFLVG